MSIDLSEYEIVRSEYGGRTSKPQVRFSKGMITFNRACLRNLPEVDYIHFLIHRDQKRLVVLPCLKDDKDSFRWTMGKDQRHVKRIPCKPLYYLIYQMMNWDIRLNYNVTGWLESAERESVLVFDLSGYKAEEKNTASANNSNTGPVFPEEWNVSFGNRYENRETGRVEVFDDTAIINLDIPMADYSAPKDCNEKEE